MLHALKFMESAAELPMPAIRGYCQWHWRYHLHCPSAIIWQRDIQYFYPAFAGYNQLSLLVLLLNPVKYPTAALRPPKARHRFFCLCNYCNYAGSRPVPWEQRPCRLIFGLAKDTMAIRTAAEATTFPWLLFFFGSPNYILLTPLLAADPGF